MEQPEFPFIDSLLADLQAVHDKYAREIITLFASKKIRVPKKEKRAPRPQKRVSEGRDDLLVFMKERFSKCFSHKQLVREINRCERNITPVRPMTDILRIEHRLYFVSINNSKKYAFYALPEFIENSEGGGLRLKEECYPDHLPSIVTSVDVMEGI